jgi:hypothetical protein
LGSKNKIENKQDSYKRVRKRNNHEIKKIKTELEIQKKKNQPIILRTGERQEEEKTRKAYQQ